MSVAPAYCTPTIPAGKGPVVVMIGPVVTVSISVTVIVSGSSDVEELDLRAHRLR